jgi:hypothetical protein
VLDRLGRFRAATVGLAMLLGLGACSSSKSLAGDQSATTAGSGAIPASTLPASTAPASSAPASTLPASTVPTPTTAPTTAAAASAGGPCIVGAWTTTSFAQTTHGATTTGGAGIRLTITADHISAVFTGMQPVNINAGDIAGHGIYTGQESATASFPQSSTATSGTITISNPGPSDVTFQAKLGGGSYGTPISANSFPAAGLSGTWTCSGAQMTLTIPTPDGPTTWDLARNT